jgi:predicted nucleotidyltransferase
MILNEDETKALQEVKSKLIELLGDKLKRFVLFGSRARGDADETSDIDVAVVVADLTKEVKRKIIDCVVEVEIKYLVPISIIVFSEDEFRRLRELERRIALDIEMEGIEI